MDARAGDQIVIEGHKVGTTPRRGEVVSVSGSTLTVRWDGGHETVFVPGPDCRVLREGDDERAEPHRFGASIDLRVAEDADGCEAVATLMTKRGTFEGRGSARRHPSDPNVPLIGEELAIGRALSSLSDDLIDEGTRADREGADTEAHLLR